MSADRVTWSYRGLAVVLGLLAISQRGPALELAVQEPLVALTWVVLLTAAALPKVAIAQAQEFEANLRMPLCVASAVVLEPGFALLVNTVALVSDRELRGGVNGWKIAFNHLQVGLSALAAALVAHAVPLEGIPRLLLGTALAVIVIDAVNSWWVSLGAVLLGRATPSEALRGAAVPFPQFAANSLLIGMLSVLVVVLYEYVGPWSVSLLGLPLWIGHVAQRSAREASDRADELADRLAELQVLNRLGTDLMSTRTPEDVMRVGTVALAAISPDLPPGVLTATMRDATTWPELSTAAPELADLVVPDELAVRRDELDTVQSTLRLALRRTELEQQLREAQRAEAELARQILAEGTIERSRIALDVHDDVLPYLAAAQLQADNVLTFAQREDLRGVKDLVPKVVALTNDGIGRLRTVLSDLQRQTVVPGDLVPWLQRVVGDLRFRQGLSGDLDAARYQGDGVPHTIEVLVAETVTGCLANIAAHAGATSVTISLSQTSGTVVLQVKDDGRGFDPAAPRTGDHHGLALMRQRAALAGGRLDVESSPGQGTRVRLGVPVHAHRPPASAFARPSG